MGADLMGGDSSKDQRETSSQILKYSADKTDELSFQLNVGRSGHCSVKLNNKIYTLGWKTEVNRQPPLFQCFKLPSLDSHVSEVDFNKKRFGMCQFGKDKLIVAGGVNGMGDYSKSCHMYCTTSKRWQQIANLQRPTSDLALVWYDNKVLATGGRFCDYFETNLVFKFDPDEGTWSSWNESLDGKEMPMTMRHTRFGHSAVVAHDKLYIIGGIGRRVCQDSVEMYSKETRRFTFVRRMINPRAFFGCCAVDDDDIFVFGGRKIQLGEGMATVGLESGGYDYMDHIDHSSVESYCLKTYEWSEQRKLPQIVSGCTAVEFSN